MQFCGGGGGGGGGVSSGVVVVGELGVFKKKKRGRSGMLKN